MNCFVTFQTFWVVLEVDVAKKSSCNTLISFWFCFAHRQQKMFRKLNLEISNLLSAVSEETNIFANFNMNRMFPNL